MTGFNPYPVESTPCRHCAHFGGMTAGDSAAICLFRGLMIRSMPERGCAYWEREPGADDDVGQAIPLADR